jgi:hypothetical protein
MPATLPSGTVGFTYYADLVVSNAYYPLKWDTAGTSLPPGLVFDSTGSHLVGTPTAPGNFTFRLHVTDSYPGGPRESSASYTIQVTLPPLQISGGTLAYAVVGQPYTFNLTAQGGTPPYQWVLSSGALPAGLTLSATGSISGTPTRSGNANFSVTVTCGSGVSQQTGTAYLLINVYDPLTITSPSVLPNAVLGAPYSFTLQATGFTSLYRWKMAPGSVAPPGLMLTNTAAIAGQPTQAGTFTFSVMVEIVVTSGTPPSVTKQFTLTVTEVAAPPRITTTSPLPPAWAGNYYIQPLTADNAVAPYNWSVSAGALPPGLGFDTAGLRGIPTKAGTYNFTLTLTDSRKGTPATASAPFTLLVNPSNLTIVSSPPTRLNEQQFYTFQFGATGATGPYTWSLAAGALPAGLQLTPDGKLQGTVAAKTAGTYPITIRVSDSTGQTATSSFTLVVMIPNAPLAIATSGSLPPATVGKPYSFTFTATGGIPEYRWSGTAPPGLSISTRGVLTGTPTTAGNYNVNVTVMDAPATVASGNFTLEVKAAAQPLAITTGAALPAAMAGQPYSQVFAATGGQPGYRWSAGALPDGLVMRSDGLLSGSPTAAGGFTFSVRVTDNAGATATGTFTLQVQSPPLQIVTPVPQHTFTTGDVLSLLLQATGGAPPYTWSVIGQLPPGVSLLDNALSGTLQAAGSFSLYLQVVDSAGKTATEVCVITVVGRVLTIAPSSLPDGTVGVPYSVGISVPGGSPPYVWSVTGLPGGLYFNYATFEITGNPTAWGTSVVSVSVTDSTGGKGLTNLSLKIAPPALAVTTADVLPQATVGLAYSEVLTASGGVPPYRWSVPAGSSGPFSLSPEGLLTGTALGAGSYTFEVQVQDARGALASTTLSVTVALPVLAISTAELPGATVGSFYSAAFAATGALGTVTWSASGLPNGMTLGAGGTLSGTIMSPGAFSFTVSATDEAARLATGTFGIVATLPVAPNLDFTGLSETGEPGRQLRFGITADHSYPLTISGVLTLGFSAGGADDPAIQFSTGGRKVEFTIPAGATQAAFPAPWIGLQTGTLTGTLSLSATLSWEGTELAPAAAQRAIVIGTAVPMITAVSLVQTTSGFNVLVTGQSNTREISQANFTVEGATVDLPATDVAGLFSAWFANPDSLAFGGQFIYTQPVVVREVGGDTISVTVTLTNAVGTSQPAAASLTWVTNRQLNNGT